MLLGGIVVLSFVTAFIVERLLLSRLGRFALDEPNGRSLHTRPVPRTGGVGVLAGALVAAGGGALALWLPLGLALGLASISLIDDVYGLRPSLRFAAHMLAAGLLVWYLLSPMNPLALLVLVLAVAWITNLYNFMDGSDGLAGGMSLVGFSAYGIAAWMQGDTPLATLSFALSAASLAFLIFNFHPARIFLGDVGSVPLGFLAGSLGLVGWRNDVWPLWFPVLVFGPFMGDATVTLLKRLARRQRPWEAHREHYYQRMVRMGLGHRRTAYISYCAMVLCSGLALLGRQAELDMQALAFLSGSVLLAGMAIWVDLRWNRWSRAGIER